MAPEISVVIPTYNRRERLRACLESLAGQTLPPDKFEVVVVVDGSSDGTEEMLADLTTRYPLRFFTQPPTGASAARNLGVENARGRVVLLLDDDMIASQGFVEAHLDAQRAGKGVVGIGHIERRLLARSDRFARLRAVDLQGHYDGLRGRPATPRDAYSGNMSLERSHYLAVGGFAAGRPMEFDDLVFAVRLDAAGARFQYLPRALTTEVSTADWRSIVDNQRLRGQVSVSLIETDRRTLPWLPVGGRGGLPRRLRLLQEVLLDLRVPASVVARCALFLPGDDRSRSALNFAFHYAYWSGVRKTADRLTWRRIHRGVPILMYHAVGPPGEPASRFVVSVRRLERQMRWLARRGYVVISLDEYLRIRSGFSLPPPKSIVVTFDDGYGDNLELARPILERLRFPATMFLISAVGECCASGREELDSRRLVSLEEARAALGGVFSFGAHTRTHPRLTQLPAAEVEREVAGSKNELEAALGVPVLTFAYPYGKFDDSVRRIVEEAGFVGAVTVGHGTNRPATDAFALRRTEVCGTDSLLRFALTVWFGDLRRCV